MNLGGLVKKANTAEVASLDNFYDEKNLKAYLLRLFRGLGFIFF